MKNKNYISFLIFSFSFTIVTLIFLLATGQGMWALLANCGFFITNIVSLLFLLKNSTFRKTIFFNITMALMSALTFGILFKIMHWPWNQELITLGLIGIAATYLFRFIKKKDKSRQDIFRLLWVTTVYTFSWAILFHFLSDGYALIPNIILLITVADYSLTCYKDRVLLDK